MVAQLGMEEMGHRLCGVAKGPMKDSTQSVWQSCPVAGTLGGPLAEAEGLVASAGLGVPERIVGWPVCSQGAGFLSCSPVHTTQH